MPCRSLDEPMPPWRRRLVTISANFAGLVVLMLGFRTRISGYENYARGKELGAVRRLPASGPAPGSMHALHFPSPSLHAHQAPSLRQIGDKDEELMQAHTLRSSAEHPYAMCQGDELVC